MAARGTAAAVRVLGSSIGNLTGEQRAGFLPTLHGLLGAGEALLLGADLVKDPARLEAAYNDSRGVTAEFNRNVLASINRELGGDFDLRRGSHTSPAGTPENEWIEMLLRSDVDQRVRVSALDLEVEFAAGEEMRTEISDKFRRPAWRRSSRQRGSSSPTGGRTRGRLRALAFVLSAAE